MTRTDWLLFGAIALVWGVPYAFIKVALHDIPPASIAFGRVALATLILMPLVGRADWRRVLRRALPIAIVGFTDIALPFELIAHGERYITSSLTGLLLAAIPIVVSVTSLVYSRGDRPSRTQATGLAIGLGGVAVLLGFDIGHGAHALLGAALVGGATIAYSIGLLLIRRYMAGLPNRASTTLMLGFATLWLLIPAALERPAHWPSAASLGAIVTLGTLCTALAYVMFFALVARIGAARASVINYVCPAVTVVLGTLALHEPLHPATVAGLALIVAGSYFSTRPGPVSRRFACGSGAAG